ncbi:hypothetical protein IW147_005798 [Coemansia sp. RSA 720]|nr:hypothetical protein IW147_005798 [Coemansia sp. RSA 720]
MNQNPFAFFSPDGGYAQLPDTLNQTAYLDAHGIKDESMHTSSMSQASHESDSQPSTPSKSKADRRTPKSKAEVSERMRRWRSENAEKNRLNDLRCRVYRQARIRFGKEPTPEREAWIQSEIFRRLERRRLREAMKGNGSVPAPTAIANPAMSHGSGGPLTRSRSTVHPFPMHMQGHMQGMGEMGFSAPYSMMYGQQQQPHYPHHVPPQHPPYLPPQYAHGYSHAPPQDFTPAPSADLYNSFKFISPLYPGRLLPQSSVGSAPHQPQPQLHDGPHTVPSHQPMPDISNNVDFSNSFQLPQGSYPYYNDAVPVFEASSNDASHNQSLSSPSTPTDTVSAPPHYALVSATSPATSQSAFTSLGMVDPVASPSLNDVASNLFSLRQVARVEHEPQVTAVDRLAVVAAAAADEHAGQRQPFELQDSIHFQNYS